MGQRQSQITRYTLAADALTPVDLAGATQVAIVKGDDGPVGMRIYSTNQIDSTDYFRFIDPSHPLALNVCDDRLFFKADSDVPGETCVLCIWAVM